MKRWHVYCQNKECSEFGKMSEIRDAVYRYDEEAKEMKPVLKNSRCSVCGHEMVLCGVDERFVAGNVSIGIFNGLSDAQKHEVLLNRYRKRMNKDEIHENRKKTIAKGIGYDK